MGSVLAVDCETTGLELHHSCEPFMVCTLTDEGHYRTWQWPVDPISRKVSYDSRVEELAEYLSGNTLVFHHANFDLRSLSVAGIEITCSEFDCTYLSRNSYPEFPIEADKIIDTQLLSHVINSQGAGTSDSKGSRHALKPLALYYLDIPEGDQKDLQKATVSSRKIAKKLEWTLGKDLLGKSKVEMDYWMPKQLFHFFSRTEREKWGVYDSWEYLCEYYCKQDCYRTIGLYFYFNEVLLAEGLTEQFQKERNLQPATYLMEHFGLYVDRARAEDTYQKMANKMAEMKSSIEDLLSPKDGARININSGTQLADSLERLGVTITNRTEPSENNPEGQRKTDALTLANLAKHLEASGSPDPGSVAANKALRLLVGYNPDRGDDVEICDPGYRNFKTGLGYITGYINALDPSGILHPSFNQVGTAWTRFSSSNPNGQNISGNSVLSLRKLFGPPPGYIWLSADYSQVELRIFAFASGDEALLNAFSSGVDFHSITASQLFDSPPEDITKDQRRIAKAVNFGIIYGAGPRKIDQTTRKPGTYQLYMNKFPGARKFMDSVSKEVDRTGYVRTLDGYRLRVPDDKPYVGVNAIVQGTAGTIVKRAMVKIHNMGLVDWHRPSSTLPYGGSAIIANVHDELLFQFPKTYPYLSIGKRIAEVMVSAGSEIGVETPVDCKLVTTEWSTGTKFI